MKKLFKRVLALTLAATMLFSLAACNKNTNTDDNAEYTYNTYMEASPTNWNPHTWEMNSDSEMQSYINMGFVDISIAEDGVNFEWVYEMADSITDITKDFEDRDKWGITEDSGRVFEIKLNQAAKWEDGTVINADSYIYSMQMQLSPEMKNYRANSYFEGDASILNAKGYFNNDQVGQKKYADAFASADEATGAVTPVTADKYYINADVTCYFYGDTLANYIASYAASYPEYAALEKYVGQGYVEVTDEVKAELTAVAALHSCTYEGAFYEFCFVEDGIVEEVKWEEVGLYKADDYTLIYITENACEMFYFLTNATSIWLVHQEKYEECMDTVGELKATTYCTDLETTMSYGPYKLTSYEKDKEFVFEKNDQWYGWNDGKHEGQFKTTKIVYQVLADHNTQLQLFNQGKLDGISLTADDMDKYRMSEYLMKTDQTYTFRFIFASDLDALTALEAEANDGANKKVLYYDDFRKAISLAMDRSRLASEATSAYKPAYYLLNYLYYTDIANDSESQYRRTDEAMEAVLRLYGIEYGEGKTYATAKEAYEAVTGYDVEQAKQLFQAVYTQAIADGNYTDGQAINITCMCSAAETLGTEDIAQEKLMNEFVAAATVGTGFEGKITFTFKCGSATRYADVAAGKVEMIRGAWGGAAFYPFSTIRVYCEPDYMGGLEMIHESCGWDPTTEKLTITYDFNGDGTAEERTETFQYWGKSINGSGEFASDPDMCLVILSWLETGILETYQCIPWASETSASLYSQKIEYATLEYNIMYGYGGLRLMDYKYNDAEWAEYVEKQGGTLSYE